MKSICQYHFRRWKDLNFKLNQQYLETETYSNNFYDFKQKKKVGFILEKKPLTRKQQKKKDIKENANLLKRILTKWSFIT